MGLSCLLRKGFAHQTGKMNLTLTLAVTSKKSLIFRTGVAKLNLVLITKAAHIHVLIEHPYIKGGSNPPTQVCSRHHMVQYIIPRIQQCSSHHMGQYIIPHIQQCSSLYMVQYIIPHIQQCSSLYMVQFIPRTQQCSSLHMVQYIIPHTQQCSHPLTQMYGIPIQ